MIQNTRYLLGKILMFLTNFHSLVKQIIANCKFFCSVRNRVLFFIYPKKLIIFKGSMDAIFSLPLNATQTNLLSRFCTRHKSNKSGKNDAASLCNCNCLLSRPQFISDANHLQGIQLSRQYSKQKENQEVLWELLVFYFNMRGEGPNHRLNTLFGITRDVISMHSCVK